MKHGPAAQPVDATWCVQFESPPLVEGLQAKERLMLFEGLAAVWQVTGVGPPSPHSALSLGEFHCFPSLAHVDGLPNPVPIVSRWKRSSSWTTAIGKFDGQVLPGLTYVKSFSRWPVTGSVGALESGIHGATYPGTLPFGLFGGVQCFWPFQQSGKSVNATMPSLKL